MTHRPAADAVLNPDASPDMAMTGVFPRHDAVDLRSAPRLAILAAIAALAHALFVLGVGLDKPLLDLHAFRQTQTALSAYWIGQGGPILAYETPVMGYPWSIPFEFPLFQILAALLNRAGLPLDEAGRIVSFVFFVGTLWPIRKICESLRIGATTYLSTAVLYLSCPLLLFWGRTFLIETCAVFFCTLWLAFTLRATHSPGPKWVALSMLAGLLAASIKITTFPSFLMLGGIAFLLGAFRDWNREGITTRWVTRYAIFGALIFLVPLAAGIAWTTFTDHVKERNELGNLLTSAELHRWNFGTLQQKLGSVLWVQTIYERILPDVYGYAVAAVPLALAGTFLHRRNLPCVLAVLVVALVPVLIFTNLYIVHSYYSVAIAGFLVMAAGLGIGGFLSSGRHLAGAIILAFLAAAQLCYFYTGYFLNLSSDQTHDEMYEIALEAGRVTQPDEALVVLGDDWSSTIAYYSGRKTLNLPFWTPTEIVDRILQDPRRYLGDRRFGGVIYCSDHRLGYRDNEERIERFVDDRAVLAKKEHCSLLAA